MKINMKLKLSILIVILMTSPLKAEPVSLTVVATTAFVGSAAGAVGQAIVPSKLKLVIKPTRIKLKLVIKPTRILGIKISLPQIYKR
ncbi:exported hypothetical protein [Gammaproteobacteria bacterium]